LEFYADFKCISLIKFNHTHEELPDLENVPYFRKREETHPKSHRINLTHKSYEPGKICLIFEKKGEIRLKSNRMLMEITSSDSAYQKTLL